jgi:hypothetical protein
LVRDRVVTARSNQKSTIYNLQFPLGGGSSVG